jgi:hypothetical protein
MGYFTQAHTEDSNESFDASETKDFDTSDEEFSDAEIEAAEAYLLQQASIKAKNRERAILKIRHAIEDYQERKRLKDEFDYLSEDSNEDTNEGGSK